jgi:hypothetical protein
MWLLFWLLVIALILSGGGFYGRRRGYYQGRILWGWLIVIWILFLILAFSTPWWSPWWGYGGYR